MQLSTAKHNHLDTVTVKVSVKVHMFNFHPPMLTIFMSL